MTENTDFFISPQYLLPPMSRIFFSKLMQMKTSLRVPSRSGSAWKYGSMHDGEVGHVRLELVAHLVEAARQDEHVADEVGMPRRLGDRAHCETVVQIGSGEQVLHVELLPAQVLTVLA